MKKNKDTFAKRAKKVMDYYKDRTDPISKRSMTDELNALKQEQEQLKLKKQQAELLRAQNQSQNNMFGYGGPTIGDPPNDTDVSTNELSPDQRRETYRVWHNNNLVEGTPSWDAPRKQYGAFEVYSGMKDISNKAYNESIPDAPINNGNAGGVNKVDPSRPQAEYFQLFGDGGPYDDIIPDYLNQSTRQSYDGMIPYRPGYSFNTQNTRAITGSMDASQDFEPWNGYKMNVPPTTNGTFNDAMIKESILSDPRITQSKGVESGGFKARTDNGQESNMDPYYTPGDNPMRYAGALGNLYNLTNMEPPTANKFHPINRNGNRANLFDREAAAANIDRTANTTRSALGRGQGNWWQYAKTLGSLEANRNNATSNMLLQANALDSRELGRVQKSNGMIDMMENQNKYRIDDMDKRDLAAYESGKQAQINGIFNYVANVGEERLNRMDATQQVEFFRQAGFSEALIKAYYMEKAEKEKVKGTRANYNLQ